MVQLTEKEEEEEKWQGTATTTTPVGLRTVFLPSSYLGASYIRLLFWCLFHWPSLNL